MTDVPETPSDGAQATVEQAAVDADAPSGAPQADAPVAATPAALPADRPELAVGAAFAGGLVLALLLKRLGR